MKHIYIQAALCSALALATHAGEPPLAGPEGLLDLQAVTREVLTVNPGLKAARAKWEAAKERIPQARAWQDLRAGVDVERGGDGTEWMLMQAIPLSGKNRRAERITRSEAAAMLADVERMELELSTRARLATVRLANAYEQLAINESITKLLQQLSLTTQAKYESGQGALADVLSVRTDLARFQELKFDFDRIISDAQSELNLLLNRPAQSPLPKPPHLNFTPTSFELLPLQQLALAHRPELRAAEYRVTAADETVDLARREWIPDPEIRTEIRNMIGGQSAGVVEYDTGIFITVPWLNRDKYKAKIAEARHGAAGARLETEALQTETLRHVRDQLTKIQTFHHHSTLFQSKILPLSREALKLTQADYEAGRSAITAVLMAARDLQQIESTYWHHVAEHQMAIAELTPMLGGDPHMLQRQEQMKGEKQ